MKINESKLKKIIQEELWHAMYYGDVDQPDAPSGNTIIAVADYLGMEALRNAQDLTYSVDPDVDPSTLARNMLILALQRLEESDPTLGGDPTIAPEEEY